MVLGHYAHRNVWRKHVSYNNVHHRLAFPARRLSPFLTSEKGPLHKFLARVPNEDLEIY